MRRLAQWKTAELTAERGLALCGRRVLFATSKSSAPRAIPRHRTREWKGRSLVAAELVRASFGTSPSRHVAVSSSALLHRRKSLFRLAWPARCGRPNGYDQKLNPADYQDETGRWWEIIGVVTDPPASWTNVYVSASNGAQADAARIIEVGPTAFKNTFDLA
jgi:hypothetical protein